MTTFPFTRLSEIGDFTDRGVDDMRARSRFGRHDLGANAKIIDKFLTDLASRLSVPGVGGTDTQ